MGPELASSPSPFSSPAAPTTPTTSTSDFPEPLSFQLSPSTVRKKGPTLSLRPPSPPQAVPPSAMPCSTSSSSLGVRPHSARPAHLYDLPALSPSTPAALSSAAPAPSPTRRGHARTRSDADTAVPPRQLYASAVPSKRDSSPPGRSPIPKAYVRQTLNRLAPQFYQKSATADVTILLRLPTQPAPATSPLTPPQSAALNQHRRSSALRASAEITVLTYKLHREYLSTQSSLFRRYLASTLSPATPPETPSPPRSQAGRPRARLVPGMSRNDHPCLLLDLPDIASFNLLLHYVYWGDFAVVERALMAKQVDWGLLFRTIEILGMDTEVKIRCSRYWRTFIKPHNGPSIAALAAAAVASTGAVIDSPPSSASSGASTVTGNPPTASGWPGPTGSSPTSRRVTPSSLSAPDFPTSVNDDEDDDGARLGSTRAAGGGRAHPTDDDDCESFESFQARVDRPRSDETLVQLASGLDALGRAPGSRMERSI